MAVTAKTLIEGKIAENVQTTQYTASAVLASIDKFTGINHSALAATISIHIVESGGTAGDANLIVENKTIQPGQTYTFPEVVGHILSVGSFISTIAGTSGAISIRASGREFT